MEERAFSEHPEGQEFGIDTASSFDELYQRINAMGEVHGSQKVYSAEELITIIERVRHGHRDIGFVTRTYGLRDAVERLLENDSVHFKYTQGSKVAKRDR